MSKQSLPPPRRQQMSWSSATGPPPPQPLRKQMSWSPDILREEAWQRRKQNNRRVGKNKSVTDDDMEELKACFELGFGFNAEDKVDQKLSGAFPALGIYYAVNKQYNDSLSRSSSGSSLASEGDAESTSSFIESGESPEEVKSKLRQWAQAVACSIKQSPPRT